MILRFPLRALVKSNLAFHRSFRRPFYYQLCPQYLDDRTQDIQDRCIDLNVALNRQGDVLPKLYDEGEVQRAEGPGTIRSARFYRS
jgi:hypothetical protein